MTDHSRPLLRFGIDGALLLCLLISPSVLSCQVSLVQIPSGAAVKVDGKIESREWDRSATLQIPLYNRPNARVRVHRDGKNIYFLFTNIGRGPDRLYPEVMIDPKNTKPLAWAKGLFWF